MMYDGTPDKIGMILYLSAILGTRKIEARDRPPLKVMKINTAGAIDKKPCSMMCSQVYGGGYEYPPYQFLRSSADPGRYASRSAPRNSERISMRS